jgi:hypothetical protein
MYRALVMFPKAASPVEVDALIKDIAAAFQANPGHRLTTCSIDALMGPAAKVGEVGRILEADFATLDDAMAALQAEDFKDVKVATEALGSTIFLFEVQDLSS